MDLSELESLSNIAVFQMAGQRDVHVSPRTVGTATDAMRYATPRLITKHSDFQIHNQERCN
jgi:hypothetical protein